MISIIRNNWTLKICTIYFNDEQKPIPSNTDIIGYVQQTPADGKLDPFITFHVDLSKEENELFANMNRSTKNQVNRALQKDGFLFEGNSCPSDSDLLTFQNFYNKFAIGKKTNLCSSYHMETMKRFRENSGLYLTKALDKNGKILCMHIYISDNKRAAMLYSASHFRSMQERDSRKEIARANRFLHWEGIRFFKNLRMQIYDLGGITDQPSIENFKRGFGGMKVIEYSGYIPLSWKGSLILYLRKIKTRKGGRKFVKPERHLRHLT
ncbi:hypothetical protein [Bacillus sp. SJS]|uniref:hypothetical protein n=1 Tax=Bacillus sp. SJS TaxID=1423321 RepID=UPI0004DCB1C4|nr:hypothetical protein [Bacillus sp. SJS]KZZ86294.1 hypothetical protein AS29_001610 [Bacillus sp. SJS]